MNHLRLDYFGIDETRRARERAGVRTILLLLVVFLLGMAVSAFWFHNGARRGPAPATVKRGGVPAIQLSDNTRVVLSRLNGPLQIRFYALLDSATVPASLRAFADHVEQLLAAYQREADGKINLTTVDTFSTANANAALAHGIQAFNLEKGEGCYLGIALALGERKDVLPRLSPEWEPAVEPDITRAIARLEEAARTAAASTAPVVANTNIFKEIKTLIPNPAAVSVEEGTRILREAALKDFTVAAKEFQTQVKAAQQRLTQAQNSGTAAEQQAAMKNLEQIQAEQSEKLKQIAARAQAQVEAFEQVKAAAQ